MPPRHGAAACRSDVERDLRPPYNKHFVALQEVWTMVRKGRAVWRGTGKDGTGDLTTDSGVLSHTPYSFRDPLRERAGHQPGGAHRRSPRRLLHHGPCLPASGGRLFPDGTRNRGCRIAGERGSGLPDFEIGADLARRRCRGLRETSLRNWLARPRRTALSPRSSAPRSPWTSPWGRPLSGVGSRIRAKSTHKPGDGAARARLAWPAILAWI